MSAITPAARRLFTGIIKAILKPTPRENIWKFLERVVRVPMIVGSRASGPLDTGLMPQWRGLLEKYADRRCRYFTLCKAARIGGTLFFGICLVIEKILRWPGPILWLDPTKKTASRVSRQEIQPYLVECRETNALRINDRKHWTTLEMFFKNCVLSILGAGSINDLGGRQAELAIANEQDRIPNKGNDAPTPSQELEARTSQFQDTRKIVRNSTPFRETGLTWGEFLAGSQDYAYVPCPECHGYQRLTMFPQPAEPDRLCRVDADDPILATGKEWVRNKHAAESATGLHAMRPPDSERPTDPKHIKPSRDGTFTVKGIPPTGRIWWPPECKDKRANRWDADAVDRSARYECVFCKTKIRPEQLPWMNDRYQWRAHNAFAPRDHVSAHISALYSPWQSWGSIAKTWILAQGVLAKLHSFFNLILGLPFTSAPTKLTPKHLQLIQSHSPRYERQFPEILENELTLPARPVCLTMHADVQQDGFWYTMRALMPDGTRYVLAWGQCGTLAELDRIASRVWTYDHGETCHPQMRFEEFTCYTQIAGHPLTTCIIDTGYKAKRTGGIYEFLHDQSGRWVGVKGGKFEALGREKPICENLVTFNYKGQGQQDVKVIMQNDYILQEHLSRFVLKDRRTPAYHLPILLDDAFVDQMTAPHLTKRRMPDGRTEDIWAYETDPHLYDCEKYGEVLCFILEPALLERLREKQDEHRKKILEVLAKMK